MNRKALVISVAILFLLTGLSSAYAGIIYDKSKEIESKIDKTTLIENRNLLNMESFLDKHRPSELEERYHDHLYFDRHDQHNPIRKPTTIIDGEEWDIVVPDDYPTIQGAVDHAQEYNTIMVRSGIYYENVAIEKSLILHGENKNTTIINGGGRHWVIQVIKASVTIADFTIQYSGNEFFNKTNAGIMLSKSTNSIIRNNYIKDNYIGIYMTNAKWCVIENNTISSTYDTWDGIICEFCYDTTINGNNIGLANGNGRDGMYFSHSNENSLEQNYIHHNQNGVRFYKSHDIFFIKNILLNNQLVQIQYCADSKIEKNVMQGNRFGIFFEYVPRHSKTSSVYYNDFYQNTIDAFYISYKSGDIVWTGNYWGRPCLFPKILFGEYRDSMGIGMGLRKFENITIPFLPLIDFDVKPSLEPNMNSDELGLLSHNQISKQVHNKPVVNFANQNNLFHYVTTRVNHYNLVSDSSYKAEKNYLFTSKQTDKYINDSEIFKNVSLGDIIFMDCKRYNPFHSQPGNYSDHVAIYIGYNNRTNEYEFIEAVDNSGPRICSFTETRAWAHHFAFGRVTSATKLQRLGAIRWAKQICLERNKPLTPNGERIDNAYQYHPPMELWKCFRPDGFELYNKFWYCSELVWAAYYNVDANGNIDYNQAVEKRIDLDKNEWTFPFVVEPREIRDDDDILLYLFTE